MAHFYATVTSNRKPITKCGTKNSGMQAHIRGWDLGCKVEISHDEETGEDWVFVYRTDGSNGQNEEILTKFSKKTLLPNILISNI